MAVTSGREGAVRVVRFSISIFEKGKQKTRIALVFFIVGVGCIFAVEVQDAQGLHPASLLVVGEGLHPM